MKPEVGNRFMKECRKGRRMSSVLFRWVVVSIGLCSFQIAHAQENIPLGTWRMHISFNEVHTIAFNNEHVFAATENGIMVLDKEEGSVTVYSKLNGLSSAGITSINYDNTTNQLLVGYEDGDLDILKNGTLTNFNGLKNIAVTGSKAIHHIAFKNSMAYFSMDYGVVVFDLARVDIKETWRDLGATGNQLKINQSTFLGDSIFLATANGVLGGNLNDNLLDYNNWKRFVEDDFNGNISVVTTFNTKIFAGIDNSGVHSYTNGTWTLEPYLQGDTFSFLSAAANLIATSSGGVSKVNNDNILSNVSDPLISDPLVAMEDGTTFWIGDHENGLVGNPTGGFEKFLGNGPSGNYTWQLRFDGSSMQVVSGGYTGGFLPLNRAGRKDVFSKGRWENEILPLLDLTDISFNGTRTYTSSFGYGVLRQDGPSSILYDETNSPLENISPGRNVYITSLASSSDGVWIANYLATNTYHLLKPDNSWESFSFSGGVSRYPTSIELDVNGSIWAPQSQSNGGGIFVFNKRENKQTYLTEQANIGGLPNRNVNAIAMDRDGAVWTGTNEGVAYFANPYSIFSTTVNAIRPIFENRYLLQDQKITAIAVDGGNRKWIGTENGVWLFNPTGEELVYNFNTENSPLLSNKIVDIEIDGITGEVFFATDKGIVSFRSDATSGNFSFDAVKIFPNPVTPDFNGTVAISGLITDAIVKITDVSGKLVWQSRAEGGTATWGVRDYTGKRVSTGVYLVFASTEDGSNRVVGKLAVIN